MIRYIENKHIDFEKWDHCIENAINGIIYPYSFYLDQVAPGWDALVFEDYQAVMPLPCRKKNGFNYIFQPFFVQQLGVFSRKPLSEKLVSDFLKAIPKKFSFISFNLNTYNHIKAYPGAAIRKRRTYELDLIAPYEMLKANYSENTRRNLKKSEKEKVFITLNSNPDIIIESFRQNRGRSLRSLTDSDYTTLKYLIYSGLHRGNTVIYSAYDTNNSFCAGVVFIHSHQKSILIFSGTTPAAMKNGAMTAIIDQFISDHAGQNITLDFEGSDQQSLARFYRGFGSKECEYLQLTINNFPLILRPLTNIYLFLRKKFSGN